MSRTIIATNPTFPYTDAPPASGGPYYYQVEVVDSSGYVVALSDVLSNETPNAGFVPAAADFVAAVVATLQGNAACALAFGNSPSTPKFQGIQAATAVALPYARILELPADTTFESADGAGVIHYYEAGELQVDVFATSESQARTLSRLVAAALDDAPLVFATGTCLEIRQSRAFFTPEPDAGPGAAIVYHRVVSFRYRNQSSL